MPVSQLYFVSGKGGVGKTTVAVSLGKHAAAQGMRVLIVDPSPRGGTGSLLGSPKIGQEPMAVAPNLHTVQIEPRALLEGYFKRLLRLPVLSRFLFESQTFNALSAAAPGVTEFLILESLLRWTRPGSLSRRPRYDLVIVDGPATGHARRLFRAPHQLAAIVAGGPIGSTARQLVEMLSDCERTHILLVTIPDEMAVNETVETQNVLMRTAMLNLTRPVLNRVPTRYFTRSEAETIADLSRLHPADPLLAAARLQISTREEAQRHLGHLRHAFGKVPISVREFCKNGVEPGDLEWIGATVWRGVLRKK